LLFDADGLEVEASDALDDAGWWLATLDDATWRDGVPPEAPSPSIEVPQSTSQRRRAD
jgi:hypothetical protein